MIRKARQHFIRGLHSLRAQASSFSATGSVVTIGSFDGVHLGHQAILRQVIDRAKALGVPSVVIVFEPQPHEYFAGEKAPPRLMRIREKTLELCACGIDKVVRLRFDESLSGLSADDFIQQILVEGLGLKYLVVGDDFRFGSGRGGNFQQLQEAGKRFGFGVTDTVTLAIDNERVSSTRIRNELLASHFAKAAELLGRPYTISGRVGYGQQLGRTLGVPTANVQLGRHRSPISGVFAVQATVAGQVLRGVANVGIRPTVGGETKPLLEVHLFDFAGNVYGRKMVVEFLHKLRDEKKFESIDLLKAQINCDIAEAKAFFAAV